MENWPRITVVTPSFNQAQFIEETITSVIDQDYPNLEYFIVDGGSTDGTLDIIHRYVDHIDWWVSEKDEGQSEAIGKGFARATGHLIAWLNSDDVYFPGALRRVGEAYRRDPNGTLYIGSMAVGAPNNGPIDRCTTPPPSWGWLPRAGQVLVLQQSSFFNRERYNKIGGINRDIYIRMDGDLVYRLLNDDRRVVVVDGMVGFIRWHAATKSSSSVGRDRYAEENQLFFTQIGLPTWQRKAMAGLFRFNRLISGAYLGSLRYTWQYRGQTMQDIWATASQGDVPRS